MTITANDFLMGGGVKSASFPTIGTTVSGRIVRTPEVRQQTTPEGTPKTFDNGDPMMQLVVQVQTDQRDPQDTEDDGVRALYIKSNMLAAVRAAVRTCGAKGLEVGGTLTVTYTGDGEKKRSAFNAPKLYAATYTPPTAQAANDYLMGSAAQPAQAAAAGVDAPPPGVDPAMWASLNDQQKAAVRAATSNTPPF